MSIELAGGLFAGLIFVVVAYVFYQKQKNGKFPKLRNPFYYE